ncbi:hypothetical protein BD779DRAFT_1801713 [Infundibulicybe gibba]|nr:hypothetical protein BD779DRAFT_1801713 [Infundibulicybe gibba]
MFSSFILLSLIALSICRAADVTPTTGQPPGFNVRTFWFWYTPDLYPKLFQGDDYVEKFLSSAHRDALSAGVSGHLNSLAARYFNAAMVDLPGEGAVCQQLGILQQIGESGSLTGKSLELQFFAQTAAVERCPPCLRMIVGACKRLLIERWESALGTHDNSSRI